MYVGMKIVERRNKIAKKILLAFPGSWVLYLKSLTFDLQSIQPSLALHASK